MTVNSSPEILLTRVEIEERTAAIAREISADFPDGALFVGVLKGSLIFLADLVRRLSIPCELDFLAISRFAPDTGRVRILKDLDHVVTDLDVVLVEDIVDTGLTVEVLRKHVLDRGARRVEVCTMLDRTAGRIVPAAVKYRVHELANEYVLGYGLHHDDLYRNVNCVVAVDPSVLHATPSAYIETLYGKNRICG